MEFKDYYEIMGLSRDASQEDIKRAYGKLARKYHPDVSKERNAEERFKGLGEAYEVLKDPEKRTAYEQIAAGRQHGESFTPPPDWTFDSRAEALLAAMRPDSAIFSTACSGAPQEANGQSRIAAGQGRYPARISMRIYTLALKRLSLVVVKRSRSQFGSSMRKAESSIEHAHSTSRYREASRKGSGFACPDRAERASWAARRVIFTWKYDLSLIHSFAPKARISRRSCQ
jgi:curved DNA-binding protein CbpA